MALDPGIAALLKKLAASPRPKLYDVTPDQARMAYRQLNVDHVTPANQIPVASVEDLTIHSKWRRPDAVAQALRDHYLVGDKIIEHHSVRPQRPKP